MIKQIIFVSDKLPYPPDLDGNNENIFNIIYELKKKNNFQITFFLHADNTKIKSDHLSKFNNIVDSLIIKKNISKYFFLMNNFFFQKFKTNEIIFFCNFNSGFLSNIYQSPKKILYAADSATLFYSKQKSFKSYFFYIKHIFEESLIYPLFEKVLFVSNDDLIYTKNRHNNRGVFVPIGYSVKNTNIQKKKYDLIFTGDFSYMPNSDAAHHFLNNLFYKLINKFPNLKVGLIGRNPTKLMKIFKKKYKENLFIGEVDNIEQNIKSSKIYFSFLNYGSGMKNKILQALASKVPIICNSESVSGMKTNYPEGLFVIDNEVYFFEQIKFLLSKNQKYLDKLGKSNLIYFNINYSWTNVIRKYYINQVFKNFEKIK